MMFDEDLPQKRQDAFKPLNLEQLSVDELEHYITELNAEIVRVQQDIEQKKNVKNAAESIFK